MLKNEQAPLVIERVFSLPRQVVWKAWIDCNEVKGWWGPLGFSTPYCAIDLRVGGKYLLCMRSPEGRDFWSTGTYLEVEPMERLVMTDSFADEKGNIVPATHYGMASEMPLEADITVTFKDLDKGRSKLTLRHEGLPPSMAESVEKSWNESFDKLAAKYGSK